MESLHFKSRANRNSVELAGIVTRANGGTQNVLINDLSIDGCRVQGYFRIGEMVKLKLPRIGELNAQVRWAIFGRAGLRFIRSVGR